VSKKTKVHPKADPKAQEVFVKKIQQYTALGYRIVYVDESGFADNMPRLWGYSKKGERCYDTIDWHERSRTNIIGAIIDNKFITACLFDGNINAEVFHTWLVEDLCPKLHEPVVVVMDNATFHKRKDTQAYLKQLGHILEYLPAYSPHLNPIEHKWFVAKARKRRTGETTFNIFKNYDIL